MTEDWGWKQQTKCKYKSIFTKNAALCGTPAWWAVSKFTKNTELWNKLPVDIRSCDNLNLFKRKLKAHLFSNYFKQIWFFKLCKALRTDLEKRYISSCYYYYYYYYYYFKPSLFWRENHFPLVFTVLFYCSAKWFLLCEMLPLISGLNENIKIVTAYISKNMIHSSRLDLSLFSHVKQSYTPFDMANSCLRTKIYLTPFQYVYNKLSYFTGLSNGDC